MPLSHLCCSSCSSLGFHKYFVIGKLRLSRGRSRKLYILLAVYTIPSRSSCYIFAVSCGFNSISGNLILDSHGHRGRFLMLKTHRVENRYRFSEPKIGIDFWKKRFRFENGTDTSDHNMLIPISNVDFRRACDQNWQINSLPFSIYVCYNYNVNKNAEVKTSPRTW